MEGCPDDVLWRILKHLTTHDVLSLCVVSKGMQELCGDKCWRRMCAKKYLLGKPSSSEIYPGWKFVYFWKDKFYYKAIQASSPIFPVKPNNALEKYLKSMITGQTNVEPIPGVKKVQRDIYSFIDSHLKDESDFLDTLNSEMNQMRSSESRDEYRVQLLFLKILYRNMILAKSDEHFIVFALQNAYSSTPFRPFLCRVAFWCMSFSTHSEFLLLGAGTLMKYLSSPSVLEIYVAANFVAQISYLEWVQTYLLHPASFRFLMNPDRSGALASKALVCLLGFAARSCKSDSFTLMLDILPEIFDVVVRDFSLALAYVNLVMKIIDAHGEDFVPNLLYNVVSIYPMISKHEEYYYHGTPHPWLRVKLLQCLARHSAKKLRPISAHITDLLDDVFSEVEGFIKDMKSVDSSRVNSVFSVFFEGIKLGLHVPWLNLEPRMKALLTTARAKLPADLRSVGELRSVISLIRHFLAKEFS